MIRLDLGICSTFYDKVTTAVCVKLTIHDFLQYSFLFSTLNCCHCAGVLGVSMFETLVLSVVYVVFFYTEPLFTKDMVTITVV